MFSATILRPKSIRSIQLANSWVCNSCRLKAQPRANFSSSKHFLEKPYYVTTPIFYVNAAPHVGHLYTMVMADILKRWQSLNGKSAILCTGTDEHGMKIQGAAAQAKIQPKEFCNDMARIFKALAKEAGIANDHFVRTTDEDHKDAVQYFWTMLSKRGYIYQTKHEGWYCISDETFYPESAIEKRLDPSTGRPYMASKETKNAVEWISEMNYHFRLSAMRDRLLQFYADNPKFVVPAARMTDVVNWVSAGLEDLSISRPVQRLSWGIPVPDDETQTIYVWLDALVNYITKAGYPWAPGASEEKGWPADVQVIGKDIVRFHCIYWPAFLLAADLQPPKQILTHAHWTMNSRKMSKSTGNVVSPFFAIERFGIDTMRFFLAHDGGIQDDSDYGNDRIATRYKKCLQGSLGGLLNRVTRTTVWDLQGAVQAARDGRFPKPDSRDKAEIQVEMLMSLPRRIEAQMKALNPGAALQEIMDVIYETNKYLTMEAPWLKLKLSLNNGQSPVINDGNANAYRSIYISAEALRIVGILLQPFMPGKAEELLDRLGVPTSRRSFTDAEYGADFEYGRDDRLQDRWGLFPPLPVVD